MNRDSMRSLYENGGEKKFAMTMINKINEGKITDKNFSLLALWQAMGEPNLGDSGLIESRKMGEMDFTEALTSSAFPKITGALINKMVQQGYDLEYGIGDQLVTVVPSTVKDETMVGFTDDMEMKEVQEGIDYEEGSVGEKYHKIKNVKFGRVISLTRESILFDQTGQLVLRAKRLGEAAKSSREKTIMNAVIELTTSGVRAAWRPNGTATTLYSSSSNDPFTSGTQDNLSATTLADETALTAAQALFAQFTDEQGLPITVNPRTLLTAVALDPIGRQICFSGQAVKLTTPQGVLQPFQGTTPLSTSFIDQLKSATAWWYGDFKKQFVFTEVWPLETYQLKGDERKFKADVIFSFKAGYYGGCGAMSNRFVVQGNA